MDDEDEKRRDLVERVKWWAWGRMDLVLRLADAKEAEDGESIDRAVTRVKCVDAVRRPRLVGVLGIRDAGMENTRALSMYSDGDGDGEVERALSSDACIVFEEEEGDGRSSMVVCLARLFGTARVCMRRLMFRVMFG